MGRFRIKRRRALALILALLKQSSKKLSSFLAQTELIDVRRTSLKFHYRLSPRLVTYQVKSK